MKTNFLWRLASVMTLLAMLISPVGSAFAAPSAAQSPAPQSNVRVVESTPVVSQPLRSLAPIQVDPNAPSVLKKLQDRLVIPKTQNSPTNGGRDASIVQNGPVKNNMPAAVANFEGVNNVSGVLPPDTQGDMGWDPISGTKYYVEWVNLAFQIWDVTTPGAPVSLYGPAAGNTLWSGLGGICAANNDGDPITQFDHLANRWIMSQFALGFPDNFHQCIAVSASPDPTGAWYLYDFQTSTTMMNDYPKFGVWPDGYYMTVNQFNGGTFAWGGAGVAAFERTAMLAGLPATMQYIDVGAVTLNYGGMLPSDLDGPAPAVGTPNYFMEWDDSTWLGDAADTLRIWEFHVDWATPASTTFGLAGYAPNAMIATANVDPDMCGGARNCIDQPGTAQGLDAIADRLMYRLQYRDFGSHQTLVTNHTVDADGADHAGVHWFELRDSGAGFVMNQEGVYAGDAANTDSRWMGSIAMDASGNMALGYSVSGAAVYPSVRYTGRLDLDPANTLPQGETSLIAGGGSQTHSAARWGDYSMMAVDASDGCTFWYTQEYYATTSSAGWQTRIGSFKFPSCTTAPTSVLQGTVTDSGSVPIVGATIDVSGGYSTATDAVGHYAINLEDGTYSVTASKYGYVSSNAPAVVVTAPDGATQDFTLATAAMSTISGVVTDAATGWPLYARIDIYGYPSSPVFSDPVTGAYSVNLVNGNYTFTVSALSGGYTSTVLPLVVAGDATQDFALVADLVACSAPGYVVSPPAFSESFETWPLTGWTIVDNAVTGVVWDSNTNWGDGNYTGGSGTAADVNSDASGFTDYDTELVSPVIDPTTLASKNLVYKANFQSYSGLDALDLDITNDGGVTWTNVSHWTTDQGSLYALPGVTAAVDLTPFITTNFQLRWRYYTSEVGPWDWYAQVDEVSLGAGCSPMPSSGLVIGAVFDANTSLLVSNASVEDAALNSALLFDASADPATPDQMYVIGELAGAVTLTASAPLYGTDTQSPTVVAGGTVGQDFNLAAGMLSADPASLTFEVASGAPTESQLLTLNNTGGVAAGYEVFALPGTWSGYTPTGPFAANTRHTGPKNLNDRDASNLRIPSTPPNVPLINGGTVSASWPTGLAYAWGIGFNTDATDLWLGNIGVAGGDDLNYRFTTAGVNTGDTIDTAPWVGVFGADMTYNPFSNMLWQVNVGGDNCIYEMDPATMLATGNKICPAFGTSERGLAFDPLTNTYYAGSWNDAIINHFAPDGTMLASVDVGLDIASLAFNPSTGHLFVMVSATGQPDIYVLDTNTPTYDIVGAFYIKDGAAKVLQGSQAGLEIDCDGNLWAVNQGTQEVYVADSGETGVCDWQSTWLSTLPITGSILAGGNVILTVSVDATGMPAGTYTAYLRIVGDTPYGDEIVPVTLTVIDSYKLYLPLIAR